MIPFMLGLLMFVTSTSIWACTRALWVNDKAVVVGRTMDWKGEMGSNIWVYPRGIQRDGLADVNSMDWVSKYGSIVTMAYDAMATDGMNEKGLAVHVFWLRESNYGTRDPNLPGMSVLIWMQYYLDNFASVDEAVNFTQSTPFQVEPFELEEPMSLHFIMEDSTGDSAIVEYIDGQPHIYHDRSYTVAANSPTYDKQLANLRLYKGFGGDKPLPGTTDSSDRFVRAAYYVGHLPEPQSERDAITKILSVTSNSAMPYGTSSEERPTPSETIWHTALDLTHHVYYFFSTTNHNLIWASLDKFNLNDGAPVLKLDVVNQPNLSGDVTRDFKAGYMLKSPRKTRIRW
jgi:choloylglycine hydrolase